MPVLSVGQKEWLAVQIAKVLAAFGLLAMTVALIYGFTIGDFGREGSVLLSMPWGAVSLVDVYVGLALFSGWIVYRENSPARSIAWIVLLMGLGFWAASLYTLLVLHRSGGSWKAFWLGNHFGDE